VDAVRKELHTVEQEAVARGAAARPGERSLRAGRRESPGREGPDTSITTWRQAARRDLLE
jgi:hypothetical protein